MRVRPSPSALEADLVIRDESGGRLPAGGIEVRGRPSFWLRRIADGDCVEVLEGRGVEVELGNEDRIPKARPAKKE